MGNGLTVVPPSQLPLDELPAAVNAAHRQVLESANAALQHAYRAGLLLLQAKAAVTHGEWLPWLAEHFDASEDTAQVYLRIAKRWDEIAEANTESSRYLSIDGALKVLSTSGNGDAHVAHNSGEQEWYTPAEYLKAARRVLKTIDLDPASSETAQRIVSATSFFTEADDGLTQPWRGKVWMNPPYKAGIVDKFMAKLCEEFNAGRVRAAITLTNNATDTTWFQDAAADASAMCLVRGRIKYLDESLAPAKSPLQGQALLYFGKAAKTFAAAYADLGSIWVKA